MGDPPSGIPDDRRDAPSFQRGARRPCRSKPMISGIVRSNSAAIPAYQVERKNFNYVFKGKHFLTTLR